MGYATYYFLLDPAAAWFADIFYFALLLAANQFYVAFGAMAWLYAGALHVFSWWAQVYVGHQLCERAWGAGCVGGWAAHGGSELNVRSMDRWP